MFSCMLDPSYSMSNILYYIILYIGRINIIIYYRLSVPFQQRALHLSLLKLRMGVSPWVEETEFVEAVRSVAQVQAFRGYRSAKQILMYKGQCQRKGSESLFLAFRVIRFLCNAYH
jgi:hypothetical protein